MDGIKCDVNTYTKRGNRYVGVEEKTWEESFEDFYKRSYMVYFLHKDITPRELKYINKEMDRNKRYFRGIIIFVEDKRFLKHPKFIDYHSDVEAKVVCNDFCLEYVRKFLDEKVEVCCLCE